MTLNDLWHLVPLIIIAATPIIVMLAIVFYRSHIVTSALTLTGLSAALITLPLTGTITPAHITPLLIIDGYARFFIGLIIAATAAVVLLSYSFLDRSGDQPEEFYLLILLATLGSAVLAASNHIISFFLGLELLSVSLYALIAYSRYQKNRIEAGLKYLVLAGVSSAFLLFGLALLYAHAGTMEFGRILSGTEQGSIFLMGIGMIIAGIGFKLAVVPFHLWTPDIYEGAPVPVAAYVATVSKGAVFALLLRFFGRADLHEFHSILLVFSIIAVASMIIGNLLALLQNNLKRILAYSSIAHLGYLLVAFLASNEQRTEAAVFYLVTYFVTTLGAFGVLAVLSNGEREADNIEDVRGLFLRQPWLAGIFTAMLLSLAGIPLTAGFIGKFYLVLTAVGSELWTLVIVLVITSVIGLFYYLRIIAALYSQMPSAVKTPSARQNIPLAGGMTLVVLALILVWIGVYPSPILSLIHAMRAAF